MYLDKRKMKEMVTAESYWCDGCFAYPFGEGIIEICHYFNNAGICPYQFEQGGGGVNNAERKEK